MAKTFIPLDVIRLIMDELVFDYAEHAVIGGSPPWKALQRCAETCKAWTPEAQKRLLRRIVLGSPSIFYTSKRLPDLFRLLAKMEANITPIHHVRVLHVHGRWVIHHPIFPAILRLITHHGRLQTFLWDMACMSGSGCPHWNRFPSALREAVETLLQGSTLTTVKLRGICHGFPLGTLSGAALKHLEIAGESVEEHIFPQNHPSSLPTQSPQPPTEPRVYLESLALDGPVTRRLPYYMDSTDSRLDLRRLTRLVINEFDTLAVIQRLIPFCNTSVQRLSWKFRPVFI